jgi:hypothetical protein
MDAREVEWSILQDLFKVGKERHTVVHRGERFEEFTCYRRGFHVHSFYRSETNKHVLHVWEDQTWDGVVDPTFGPHDSFSDLLKAVAEVYAAAWSSDIQ